MEIKKIDKKMADDTATHPRMGKGWGALRNACKILFAMPPKRHHKSPLSLSLSLSLFSLPTSALPQLLRAEIATSGHLGLYFF